MFKSGAITGAFGYLFNCMAHPAGCANDNGLAEERQFNSAMDMFTLLPGGGALTSLTRWGASLAVRTGLRIGILREASWKIGNFELGSVATINEANAIGRSWVGEGYTLSKRGNAWISKDGLKAYRPPTYKKYWKNF